MKDIFKSYYRHKVLTQVGIFSLSAILAVSFNMFVLNWENANNFKANVIEAQEGKVKQDFELIESNWVLTFVLNSKMKNGSHFSFTLAYDAEEVELWVLENSIFPIISYEENTPWLRTYILSSKDAINLDWWTTVGELKVIKKIKGRVIINPVQVNFSDTENWSYILSTKNIIF